MLLLLGLTRAVFFLHRKSNKFIGTKEKKNVPAASQLATDANMKILYGVTDIADATDFRIRYIDDPIKDKQYSKDKLEKLKTETGHSSLRIELPGSSANNSRSVSVFDGNGGAHYNGGPIIVYPLHGGWIQKINIVMLDDFSLVFSINKKCLKYQEETGIIVLGECTNLKNSSFDIYFEKDPEVQTHKEIRFNFSDDKVNVDKEVDTYANGSPIVDFVTPNKINNVSFSNNRYKKHDMKAYIDDEDSNSKSGNDLNAGKNLGPYGKRHSSDLKANRKRHFRDRSDSDFDIETPTAMSKEELKKRKEEFLTLEKSLSSKDKKLFEDTHAKELEKLKAEKELKYDRHNELPDEIFKDKSKAVKKDGDLYI